MKVAIMGYSGSGKSTLAKMISEKNGISVLFLDCVHWLPGWQVREEEEKREMVRAFLSLNDSWVIDGNYKKLFFEERMKQADQIIFMNFNRFTCFGRAVKRYLKYRGRTRFSITQGCDEKIDWEFTKWIFYKGRTRAVKEKYQNVIHTYPDKVTIIRNQRQLTKYIEENILKKR